MNRGALILHAVVSLALLVAYTVLQALGHDANELLGILAAYLGGAGVQAATTEQGKSGGS